MERLFSLGANHQAGSAQLAWDLRFQATDNNTGNLLIGNGLHRQLQHARWGRGSIDNIPHIRENFDRIVLPAANFLHGNFDFGQWAQVIESANLPCLMVGLGAQAPNDQNEVALAKSIPRGTVRFIQAVAHRSHSIGVRGGFTARVLEKLGVHNFDIVGCPSLYTNLRKPISIEKKPFGDVGKLAIGGSSNVTAHSYDPNLAKDVERRLFHMAKENDYPYVLQSELPEILYLEHVDEDRKKANQGAAYILNCKSVETYVSTLRQIARVFFDVQEWFDWVRSRDFVVGTRLHGAIAAILQDVPAVIICHDARTKELCEFACLPHISLAQAMKMDLREIYETADFDALRRRHSYLISRYIDFLNRNGAAHNFG